MPTSEHSLYSKIVMGMQDYAGQVGYDIITAVSYSTSTAETRQMNMLLTELLTVLSFLALSMTQIHLISSQRIITLLCVVRAWRAQMCLLSLLTMNRLRLTLSLLLSKRVIKDRLYRNELFGYLLHCKRERLYKSIKRIWHSNKE